MDLFETLKNEKFFNPLTGANKRIYFECINELIEYSKNVSVLYEENLKDYLFRYLDEKQCHIEMDEDVEDGPDYYDQDSIKIIRKFRECGWLSKPELGRNGEYITNITPSCRRVIDFLNRLNSKKGDAAISNKIVDMYGILQNAFDENNIRKDRPYSMIIAPLLEVEAELKNEVLDLKDSISIIQNHITELDNLSGVGSYLLDDSFLDRFFSDYFYMKNNGLILSILGCIVDLLRRFQNDELFQKAVKEYSEIMQKDYDDSWSLLNNYIIEMLYYIQTVYPNSMEDIELGINKYYRLANLRLKLVVSEGLNVPSVIDTILITIKDANPEKRNNMIKDIQDCMLIQSQKYISRKSYQIKTRRVRNYNMEGIETAEVSEEEMKRITKELLESSYNPYSLERTNAYFDNLFKNTVLPQIKSTFIENKNDALMFISAFIYSTEEDFNYHVDLEDGTVNTEIGCISNMAIRRKE